MPGDTAGAPTSSAGIGAPARRALDGAEYPTQEQLAESEEAAIKNLHGVGPSALDTLREALDAYDLSFGEVE